MSFDNDNTAETPLPRVQKNKIKKPSKLSVGHVMIYRISFSPRSLSNKMSATVVLAGSVSSTLATSILAVSEGIRVVVDLAVAG